MIAKTVVGRPPAILPPDYLTRTLADVPVGDIAYVPPHALHVDDAHHCWAMLQIPCARSADREDAGPIWGKTLRLRREPDGWLADIDSAGASADWQPRATDLAYMIPDATFEPVVGFGPIPDDD